MRRLHLTGRAFLEIALPAVSVSEAHLVLAPIPFAEIALAAIASKSAALAEIACILVITAPAETPTLAVIMA